MALCSLSPPRLLVLCCAVTLMLCALLLGPRHPLTASGLIALVAGLIAGITVGCASRLCMLRAVLAGAACGGLAWWLHWEIRLAALMPALCQALLAWLVGRTLRPGQTPAIERMALAILGAQPPLPAVMATYARHSTWLWVLIFSALALFNASMALRADGHAPVALGLIDVAVATCVILIEFFYRRWRYPQHNTLTLLQFWQGLRRVNPLVILLPERSDFLTKRSG